MCEPYEIAERIKALLKIKHIKAKDMLEKLELSASTMTYMKKSYPQANNLTKIADFLECSTDYLMGRTDIIEVNRGKTNND